VTRGRPSKWVLFPRPNPAAALRLFCFHHAGGSGQHFYGWPAHLPSTVELGVIQLPGRGARLGEPHMKRLLPLSRVLSQELSEYLDRPFSFFGHSMGAVLCFETARCLRRETLPQPAHLFLSATEAPHRRVRDEPVSGLPKEAFVEKLREYDGVPEEALQNDELLSLMLPTVRADFELYETYTYHPDRPLDCSMTVCGGLGDPRVDKERLAAWRDMTEGDCTLRMFPGGHFFIDSQQGAFLRILSEELLQLRLKS